MTEELFKIPIADDIVTPENLGDKYNQGFQAGCRSMRADLEAANAERARLILELDKVRAERDAAIEDLRSVSNNCFCCKWAIDQIDCNPPGICCIGGHPDRWEWRGCGNE